MRKTAKIGQLCVGHLRPVLMYVYTLRAALGTRLDLSNFISFHRIRAAALLRKKIFRFTLNEERGSVQVFFNAYYTSLRAAFLKEVFFRFIFIKEVSGYV